MANTLWIATRKGAFALKSNPALKQWRLSGPLMLGNIIHHIVQDPRNPLILLMAAKTGHLGPTVYRSADRGKTWKEAKQPPAFAKAVPQQDPSANNAARAVDRVIWLTPGHVQEPSVWYAGTAPAGLFRTADAGNTWSPVSGFNDHPMNPKWAAGSKTPDGEFLHSILIDPRDPKHIYLSISIGGTFESLDGGADWTPLNEGVEADFLPVPDQPYGHDPHCVVMSPAQPDRLYQQNHCGSYRLDRPSRRWQRIGRNMPRKIGDIGFPVVPDPSDADTAWVFPMDGTRVWPRTSIDGKPAVYVTCNGGNSWRRLDRGLPPRQAWFTVLRQAMCIAPGARPALYFGTTGGEIWANTQLNRGDRWQRVAQHLPEIYAVTHAF